MSPGMLPGATSHGKILTSIKPTNTGQRRRFAVLDNKNRRVAQLVRALPRHSN
jgi:hypothetical protein